jgi:hypothetical protein
LTGNRIGDRPSSWLRELASAAQTAVSGTAPLIVALEEALQAFKGDVLPAGDEFGFQLVLPSGLGGDPLAGEDLEDKLGLELRGERPASAFRHGRALLGDQY